MEHLVNGTHAGIREMSTKLQKRDALTPETPENVEDPCHGVTVVGETTPTTIKPTIQISVTIILVEMMEFAIWEITILRRRKTDIGVLAEWDSRAKTARVSTR